MTYHGRLRHWTLVGVAVAGALASNGQVPQRVEVPPQGRARSEGKVGQRGDILRQNPEPTQPDPDEPGQGEVRKCPGRSGCSRPAVDEADVDLEAIEFRMTVSVSSESDILKTREENS